MAGETTLTIIGNLTADPELRSISTGTSVCNFTIASTPRVLDRRSGQWEDGQPLFMRCSAWRELADHCAQSLSKGMRVIAQGRLQQRSYQANDGTNRTVVEMQVDEIGPSLRYATAQVTRQSSGFSGGNRGGFGGGNNGGFQNSGGYQGGAGYSGGASYQSGGYQGGASSAPMAAQSGPAVDPWSDAGSGSSFSSFGATTDFGGDSEEPEF